MVRVEKESRESEEPLAALAPDIGRHKEDRAAGAEAQEPKAHRQEREVIALCHRVDAGEGELQEQDRRREYAEA